MWLAGTHMTIYKCALLLQGTKLQLPLCLCSSKPPTIDALLAQHNRSASKLVMLALGATRLLPAVFNFTGHGSLEAFTQGPGQSCSSQSYLARAKWQPAARW